MQDKNIQEYIESHPELDEETKQRMLEKDKQARKAYNEKINRASIQVQLFSRTQLKLLVRLA